MQKLTRRSGGGLDTSPKATLFWKSFGRNKEDLRASPLRPTGYVTEAETHQAADVEVMEMHQCE